MPADFERISTDRLEREIGDLAGRIAAATCRWLLLIAEFDRRRGHEEWGFHCCARWLAWRCSVVPRSAREHLRVARRLGELPLVTAAFSRGELSYSKVRAITRVVAADALEQERELVELARHATAAQLERVVRACRGALSTKQADDSYQDRYLIYDWEEDGSLSIRGRLPAEEGALLLRALEAGRDAVRDARRAEGGSAEPLAEESSSEVRPRPLPARETNADAVVVMAESLLANGRASRAAGERHQVVVHVDADALVRDWDAPGHRCQIDDGPSIAAEAARRLSCDGSLLAIVEGTNGPLSVGRRTRAIPPAMRRALRARDRGCRFPGCTHERWVDGHHLQHWARGGETSLVNLVQLCPGHHRLVHEGGFSVERRSSGRFVFRRPDGRVVPGSHRLRSLRGRAHAGRGAGLPPVASSPAALSAGEPLDVDLAVAGLVGLCGPAP